MSELTFVLANRESPSTFLTNAKNVDAFPTSAGDVMEERAPTKDMGVPCDVSIGNPNRLGGTLVVHLKKPA